MTISESILKIDTVCLEVSDDCRRLAGRGGIALREATALRSKLQTAMCAALELESRTREVDEPKKGE